MYTVIIETSFIASHAVMMPDGVMEDSHSHEWKLEVGISSNELDKFGFAGEFGQIKSLIDRALSELDGKNLNHIDKLNSLFPTTEVVVEYLYNVIFKSLSGVSELRYLELTEAAGCRVRYEK